MLQFLALRTLGTLDFLLSSLIRLVISGMKYGACGADMRFCRTRLCTKANERHKSSITLDTRLSFPWELYQSSSLARRAPSERLRSLAQTMRVSTVSVPAKVPKPQSTPAMTRSRPTTLA